MIIGGSHVCKLSDGAVFGEIAAPWLAYGRSDPEADNYVKKYINIPSEKYIYVHIYIYVYMCFYIPM